MISRHADVIHGILPDWQHLRCAMPVPKAQDQATVRTAQIKAS